MRSYRDTLTPTEIAEIVGFLRSLRASTAP
jgi:hypothetical protein